MLGYLNGIGRAKKSSGSKITKTKTKGILKKAFKILPIATAVRVAKKVIAKNKTKPRAASQNTQFRALKNAVAQKKARTFVKKNKALFLDEQELNETPVMEQDIIDDQLDQEVENEIDLEDEFTEEQADLGIFYPTTLSGRADRKARKKEKKDVKLDKKKAKTEKIRSKAELKKQKGQAKVDRANRPKGSLKDITSTVLDTVKGGVAVFKDIKGGGSGSGDESLPDQSATKESFISKNKTLLIIGGAAILGGAFLLMRNKGKGK